MGYDARHRRDSAEHVLVTPVEAVEPTAWVQSGVVPEPPVVDDAFAAQDGVTSRNSRYLEGDYAVLSTVDMGSPLIKKREGLFPKSTIILGGLAVFNTIAALINKERHPDIAMIDVAIVAVTTGVLIASRVVQHMRAQGARQGTHRAHRRQVAEYDSRIG